MNVSNKYLFCIDFPTHGPSSNFKNDVSKQLKLEFPESLESLISYLQLIPYYNVLMPVSLRNWHY